MRNQRIRQNVLPVLAAMIWGTAFVAQSAGAEYVGAFTFNTARSVVAFLFLLLLCALRRRWFRVRGSPRRELFLAGGCCGGALAVASYFQQKGLETTSAGKAGFITALYIVIVPLLSALLGRKPPAPVLLSVALAVAGLYCLCVSGSFTVTRGDLSVLLCAFCFAVQILAVDRFSAAVDGFELSCAQFFTASLLSAAGMGLAGEAPSREALALCLWPVLYAGIFSSGVAYTLQILAQKGSNPTVVSLLLSLESVFAALAGALLLQERMTAREIGGCLLMFGAMALAQLPVAGERREAL